MTVYKKKPIIRVLVAGASTATAYSLVYSAAIGEVFGRDQPIILNLLDTKDKQEYLEGLIMELLDCAFPLLRQILRTSELEPAFTDVHAGFLITPIPAKEATNEDQLRSNCHLFKNYGTALGKFAKKDCRVLVVGDGCNTLAYVCANYAESGIPRENICGLTRLDQNRAVAQIALRLGVVPDKVRNVVVWGNHSEATVPDANHATFTRRGEQIKVKYALQDDDYLAKEFITTVQNRSQSVRSARKQPPSMATAKAATDSMRDWWHGTDQGTGDIFVSMAVPSPGAYGIPKDIVYSFPVRIVDKSWKIVEGLHLTDEIVKLMEKSGDNLVKERNLVMQELKK